MASTSAGAEIGVRPDANRWTIVHEFTHHQFDRYRLTQGKSIPALKAELTKAAASLKDRSTDRDPNDRIRTLVQASELVRELLTDSLLEEVAIETFLQGRYKSGELTHVPFDARSSNAYISDSAKQAKKILDDLLDDETQLTSPSLASSDALTSIREETHAIQDLEKQIDDTLKITENTLNGGWNSGSALLAVDFEGPPLEGPQLHDTCAHSRETLELLKGIVNLLTPSAPPL